MEEFLASAAPYIMATAAIFLMLAKSFDIVVRAIAPLTKSTKDDEIVAWLDDNQPAISDALAQIEKWADPEDPDVPTAPA